MKTLQVCDDAFAAELLKGRLLNEGIDAQVIHAHIEQVIPYSFGMPDLKPRVVVREEDFERAMQLLEATGDVKAEPQEIRCPYCGSQDLSYGLYDGSVKRYLTRIVAVFLSLLTMGPLGKVQGAYYCRQCKRRFSSW